MLGQGATEVEVRAIGIVTDVDLEEWRVCVRWVLTDLTRRVPFHGWGRAIHGPYPENHEWVPQVFQL